MNKRYRLLPVVLAFAGLAASCSSSEFTRADFIEEMTTGENAFTESAANCSADGMEEAGISFDEVNASIDDVDAATQEALTSIFFECALADS